MTAQGQQKQRDKLGNERNGKRKESKRIESFTNGNFIRRSGDFSAIAEVCAMKEKAEVLI